MLIKDSDILKYKMEMEVYRIEKEDILKNASELEKEKYKYKDLITKGNGRGYFFKKYTKDNKFTTNGKFIFINLTNIPNFSVLYSNDLVKYYLYLIANYFYDKKLEVITFSDKQIIIVEKEEENIDIENIFNEFNSLTYINNYGDEEILPLNYVYEKQEFKENDDFDELFQKSPKLKKFAGFVRFKKR